jgi:hypothetical protein
VQWKHTQTVSGSICTLFHTQLNILLWLVVAQVAQVTAAAVELVVI